MILPPPSYRFYAARRKRGWSRSSLARPHIWRLSIFTRLIWPSTGPLLQGRVPPALTASSASRMPLANRGRGVRGLSAARASQGANGSGGAPAHELGKVLG